MKTEYLLRFDDLCPTMDRAAWERFTPILERFAIQPILAVVPDNHDPELKVAPADDGFWSEMLAWQRRGAAIGLHGYRHLCVSEARGSKTVGLVPLHGKTEFAGAAEEDQRAWIEAGLKILHGHGLEPRVWVGPRHGTDEATVRALAGAGVHVISDGLWRNPVRWHGARWIPQQLWEQPVNDRLPDGVWTICLHANTASDTLVKRLQAFCERKAAAFTTVERVLAEWPDRRHGMREWSQQVWWLAQRKVRMRLAARS